MTIDEFNKYAATMIKEFEKLTNRDFPVKVGSMAQRHFEENFYKSGFVNNGLKPWKRSRRQSGKGTHAGRGTLIGSATATLMRGIHYVQNGNRVTVMNKVPYAPPHNWGETVHPSVTPKMRRFAWAKFFEGAGITRQDTPAEKKAKTAAASKETLSWRGMALTKKQKLSIKMPQRQFLGESKELNDKIRDALQTELEKILNI